MEKALGIIRLIRPINCLVIGFAVLVGILVATPAFSLTEKTAINGILGFTTAFTFLAAANTVNDYYDQEIDAIDKPHRPIPSGIIRPKEALGYAFILSVIGFIAAFLTNTLCLIVATIAWILFMGYATRGKRTGIFGNFIVSACIAIPFIYGGFAAEEGLNLVLIIFSTMAFLSTAGREITKGIADIRGDKLHNVKTLAVLFGPKTAAFSAAALYAAAVALSFLPWTLGEVSLWYLPPVILADGGFLSSSIALLRSRSRENAEKVKNLVRIWMILGLLAFIAGKFS